MAPISVSILGIGGAVPSKDYDNTFLAIRSASFTALIDCGGSPLQKIQKIGIDLHDLDAIIVTHIHPDHMYGLPSLLQGLGLIKREKELKVYTITENIVFINSLIDIFDLRKLTEGFLKISGFPFTPNNELVNNSELSIFTTPVDHSIPTVAVKIVNKITKKILTYSSDTAPCNQLIEFAYNSDVLIHECNSPNRIVSYGHSNGEQAGRIARLAHAKELALVHLPVFEDDPVLCAQVARSEFSGHVEIPEQFSSYLI